MGAADLLAALGACLEQAGVPWMVAGSMASTHHGEPRSTQDIDVVIDPSPDSLTRLVRAMDEDAWYVSPDAAHDALRRRSQFNVLHLDTGWKAHLIVRKNRPYSVEELRRRQRATILGVPVFVASPEDVVISKLEWARKGGGSERQLRDVRGVLDAQRETLDTPYIARWVNDLGLHDLWDQVRETP